jgi:hypothetical protein
VSTGEVEPVKSASPPYTAVSAWDPRLNDDVVNDATPPLRVPEPSAVAPSKKLTVPVGVPAGDVTVAVNVLAWPNTEGSGAEDNVVAVANGAVAVSLTVLSPVFATYACRPSGVIATPCGSLPTGMVATTTSSVVLITLTVLSPPLFVT